MTTDIRDILLFMVSYPYRTPGWALDASLSLAERFDARLSGVVCQTHIPAVGNWLADKLVHANALIAGENVRSREATTDLLNELTKLVGEERRGEQFLVECGPLVNPMEPARIARTHDLTVVPVETNVEFQVAAEALVFDSGRPVLLLPRPRSEGLAFQDIVIGWDGSRAAARSLTASLPFCRAARSVRLVAISGDKPFAAQHVLEEARRHLALHDIAARLEEVEATGRDAGKALLDHGSSSGADLLVMGAYGHSKAREFLLGGATRSILDDPQLPVLLAH